ncbi:MAG: N-acetylmuramoyl-L-alanine amidase [Rhodospirillaceae bacterium]|nr:N-acetylmuramoyl-L-alanine amidase [Rhodospirillaceae bacterium]
MDIIERASPNANDRPAGACIDMVILHYTGMKTGKAALERLCDADTGVSAHYLIDEDGTTYRMVAEARRAWHAGSSHWSGAADINDRSLGIEIVNPGHVFGYRAFPETQMQSVEVLLAEVVARHHVPPSRVVGHSDIAPTRKQDPGELFDWKRLADKGLSIWPEAPGDAGDPADAPGRLAEIGYDPKAPLTDVVTAFQRRFVPAGVNGMLDQDTLAAIAAVHVLNG